MAIRIHVASHPDALVARLVDQMASPSGGLFDSKLVAVPSRGIERWLTQQIGSGLAARGAGEGICANVEFPSPRDVVHTTLSAVPELARSLEVWEGPALVANLIETIDRHLHEPWLGLLARYLEHQDEGSPANRLAAASKTARLFSRYARRRPDMIRAWSEGDDVGPDGEPLPRRQRWQAELWRALRRGAGVASLPELLPGGLDGVREGRVAIDLPGRLAVYGLTSSDPLDLEVLTALGSVREVDLYVLHPSPGLWDAIRSTVPGTVPSRKKDPTVEMATHPLLDAWSRDSRELQTVLAAAGLEGDPLPVTEPDGTLLSLVQSDVRANRPPTTDPGKTDRPGGEPDRSVQIHVCHGARRQAEVARDAILHLLASDPTLEPRDVVIMTPDLSTFAPLLEAAFPRGDAGGLPDLRLRIADRSPAATNPLVGFTAGLGEMIDSRLEADIVRELVARPVVQNRFGFDADTAGSIVALIDDANISWGLDEDHRRQWGVDIAERTWRRGLDRALAGVFYGDSAVRTVGGLSTLDGVEGQEATPAGILAAIVDRLAAIRTLLGRSRPLSEWGPAIAHSVRLLAAPEWGNEWQLDQLERLLTETFPQPDGGGADPAVTLGEARQAIATWTDDRPSPLHFRTGDITVCTLVPMRSVPYRVVVLLGMDEDRFPRRGRLDGDDLLGGHELVGDRDAATMDRQLLLDALMAADDHFLVAYSGRDELTNASIPPAVPIAELAETLEAMVGEKAMATITTRHPLQSFSDDNFTPGLLNVAGPWGFDAMQYQGAVAMQGQSDPTDEATEWPPFEAPDTIRVEDLVRFLQNPVSRFVRVRLGFSVPEAGETPDDTIPADLGHLERWQVTDRVLRGMVAGHDPAGLMARERGSDALPPGFLGEDDLEGALQTASVLWETAQEQGYDPRRHQPYAGRVEIGGITLEGTVTADPDRGHIAEVTPSRIKGRQRLRAFVHLVFLSALHPDVAWRSILIGKKEQGSRHLLLTLGPLKRDEEARRQFALQLLSDLVDLYQEGHRRPLPLPCETAFAWQRNVGQGIGRARYRANDAFTGRFSPEARDPAHLLVLSHLTDLDSLEEAGFTEFCERLWLPILSVCKEKPL